MLVKIIYSWTDRGHHWGHHTFALVDLTAPKVAAGKIYEIVENVSFMKRFIIAVFKSN